MIYVGFFVPIIIEFTRNKQIDYNTGYLTLLLYVFSFLLTQVPHWIPEQSNEVYAAIVLGY